MKHFKTKVFAVAITFDIIALTLLALAITELFKSDFINAAISLISALATYTIGFLILTKMSKKHLSCDDSESMDDYYYQDDVDQ